MTLQTIALVADTPADFDESAGYVLRKLFEQTGIAEVACRRYTVLPPSVQGRKFESFCTKDKRQAIVGYPALAKGLFWPAELSSSLTRLHEKLAAQRPNVVIAFGPLALWALTKKTGIKKWRGSPMLTHNGEHKVIATYHPAAIMMQWSLRPVVFMDLGKALRESHNPVLRRPQRKILIEPSIEDIKTFIRDYIDPAPFIAADIETKAGQITEIGFAASASRAILIPFWSRKHGNYWLTLEEELRAWELVRRICASKRLVGQNFQYDMQYLYRVYGIPCPHFYGDTMLLHHSLQPELEKGLGFLGSVYTDEPSWKFMRTDHSTLKKEDD